MTRSIRLTAFGLLAATGLTAALPEAAEAGSKGRRNTAIALGAVAAYGVIKKKPVIAGVAGAGAIYSYMRSRQAARAERNRRTRYSRLRRTRYSRLRRTRRYSRTPRYYTTRTRYASAQSTPPGWSRGRKTGWAGRSVPPGHAKKR